MRRGVLAAALIVLGSCGGSLTSPGPLPTSVPLPRTVVLGSGPYTLTLTLSATGVPVCQNGFCTSISICSNLNNAVSPTTSFNVDLDRSGETATVRVPGSASPLVLSLRVADTSVAGTISGSARDAGGVPVDVSGTATGGAPPNSSVAVSGTIDGQMSVAAGSCSNNGHGWSLTPR